jgi:death-on-curing protein
VTGPCKRREPLWISKRAALAIHEVLLAIHGGKPGFIDEHLLDAALASPRNYFEYGERDVCQLAAVYAHALTQDHPFVDGKKRVAFTVAVTFLERNGFRLHGSEAEATQMMLDLSNQRADAAALAWWFHQNVSRDRSTRPSARKPAHVRPRKRK